MIPIRACLLAVVALAAACAAPVPPDDVGASAPGPSARAVGIDRTGIRPTGGKAYSFLRDGYVYNQRGPAWVDARMGKSAANVGDEGCVLTATAMGLSNLGAITDPGMLNAELGRVDGYTPEGLLVWKAIGEVTQDRFVVDWHDAPSAEAIDECLAGLGGHPIVKFRLGGRVVHWALVVGKQGRSWLIRDPLLSAAQPVPLESRAPSIHAVRCLRPVR